MPPTPRPLPGRFFTEVRPFRLVQLLHSRSDVPAGFIRALFKADPLPESRRMGRTFCFAVSPCIAFTVAFGSAILDRTKIENKEVNLLLPVTSWPQ